MSLDKTDLLPAESIIAICRGTGPFEMIYDGFLGTIVTRGNRLSRYCATCPIYSSPVYRNDVARTPHSSTCVIVNQDVTLYPRKL